MVNKSTEWWKITVDLLKSQNIETFGVQSQEKRKSSFCTVLYAVGRHIV